MILTTLTFIFQPAAASKLYDEKTVVKGGYWSGYRLTGTVRGYFDPEIGAVYYVSSQHYAKAEEYGAFGWLWDVCWVKVWGEAYWQGQRIKNRDIKNMPILQMNMWMLSYGYLLTKQTRFVHG